MENKKKENPLDGFFEPWDGEYIGNMWGWKFSYIGLALLLFIIALMAYRYYSLGIPFSLEGLNAPPPVDTTSVQ